MKKQLALALVLSSLLATPAMAAPVTYTFDAAHTQIMFSVNHLGFSHPVGRFMGFSGGFTFDSEKVETSSVDVSIDSKSIFMGTEAWDTHMKSADFFNVEKFPAMTFKSTSIQKTGDKTGKLTGDLTILGVTKPVTLDVTWNASGEHPMTKKPMAGFSATGTLKRSDFGMNYGLPMVGDDVALNIQVEGVESTPAPTEKK